MVTSLLLFTFFMGLAFGSKMDYEREFPDYQKMRAYLGELYQQKKYKDAAELLEWAKERFPNNVLANAYNLAIMYCHLEEYEKGLVALEYALDRGVWFGLYFFENETWKPLKEQKGFKKIWDRNAMLKQEAQKKAKPELLVITPEDFNPEKTYPLFIALHGGSENMETFKNSWKSQKMWKEFITAYPQSSQLISMNGFWWHGDIELAKREIGDAYQKVVSEYPVDRENVIIGGFSSGGVAALEVVLDNTLPVKGFIVLCPDWPESFTAERVRDVKNRGIRGFLITSEMDERLPSHKKMTETFKDEGLPHQFIVIPKIGHTYPEDLDKKIDQAIDYIREVRIIE
ncbi:MAG: hypothetical protein JSV97_04615 [candidate division WOR-3 bacterium]|nr:MAG: hypothetical protein JSV97_04615 [candidate division WOR-3 bacterium]